MLFCHRVGLSLLEEEDENRWFKLFSFGYTCFKPCMIVNVCVCRTNILTNAAYIHTYILEIGISVTINLGTPTRSVFLSIYIDWGPRGRESDHRRNFPLAHSSFWRSKNHGINIARDQWYPQLWKLTASKRTKIEDRARRHFKEHKKSFLYSTNFI